MFIEGLESFLLSDLRNLSPTEPRSLGFTPSPTSVHSKPSEKPLISRPSQKLGSHIDPSHITSESAETQRLGDDLITKLLSS